MPRGIPKAKTGRRAPTRGKTKTTRPATARTATKIGTTGRSRKMKARG